MEDNKELNIGLDLDDVLIDFNTALCDFHNREYGTNLSRDDIKTWHLEKVWNCNLEEAIARIFDFYHSSELEEAKPVEGAVEVVSRLSKGNNLHIVTSRSDTVKNKTLEWVEKYFPFLVDSVNFTNHFDRDSKESKAEVCIKMGIKIFVEDAPIHVEDLSTHIEKVYLFDAPWNRSYKDIPKNVKRMSSWKDIEEDLLKI